MSPSIMIDKIASRLGGGSSQKARPQSTTDADDEEKDQLQIIDDILAASRKHPLAELPPAPLGLSAVQVCAVSRKNHTQPSLMTISPGEPVRRGFHIDTEVRCVGAHPPFWLFKPTRVKPN